MVLRGLMTRTAFLLSSLLVTACTVGQVAKSNPGVDGGTPTDGAPAGNGCVARQPAAEVSAPHVHAAGGTSNAGQACLNAACHGGANAPGGQFQAAGTLYKPGSSTPSAGATIKLMSNSNPSMPVTAYTDSDGNFYIGAGSLPMAFPGKTLATGCPTLTSMAEDVTSAAVTGSASGGDCNGCHRTGGATAPLYLADQ